MSPSVAWWLRHSVDVREQFRRLDTPIGAQSTVVEEAE